MSLLALAPAAASAATITVNDTGDVTADDGDCTLREAIVATNSNAASGGTAGECAAGQDGPAVRDVIVFSLGAGTHVISPAPTKLPSFSDQVELDGRNGTALARVELDGAGAGANAEGLFLTTGSDGSFIHDIAVYGFSGDGVNLFSGGHEIDLVFSGTNLVGTASTLGNGGHGFDVIGDDVELDRVLASANDLTGVNVSFQADRTTITGSRIGTSRDGTADLGNASGGIGSSPTNLESPEDTVIGGTTGLTPGGACTGDCNVISGNGLDGIQLTSGAPLPLTGAQIVGNHIGTDLAGTGDLGNSRTGVSISGDVQGTIVRSNLISGNSTNGVSVSATSTVGVTTGPADTEIAGNRIGVETTGASALANGDRGVSVVSDVTSGSDPVTGTAIGGATGLTQGGACTGDCNVISGSGTFGASLFGNVDGTEVLGNHIGVDLAGTAPVANQQAGVSLADVDAVQVGEPGAGNVISGNVNSGVQISSAPEGNTVQSNRIGVGTDATTAVANGGAGISLLGGADGNLVGGTAAGEGNTIASNGDVGLAVAGGVAAATENSVLGNSITANADLGIDLGDVLGGADGVTPNDGPGDADDGGNGLQNSPELAAALAGASTTLYGRLESAGDTSFRIEIFGSDAEDPSGFGEGETLLGAFEVTTDAAGVVAFEETVTGTAGAGDAVSATATELDGQGDPLGTSEFSESVVEGCDVEGGPGDDELTGLGSSDDVICGLGGDDVITTDGGDDVVIGGGGSDEVDFSGAADAVDLDLGTEVATVGADVVAVVDVEDATGSGLDDTLTGDAQVNVLEGGDGDDTLTGGDGDDTLKGKANKDTLKGQDSADRLKGGDGGDDLLGGGGNRDDLQGQAGKDSLDGGSGNDDDCDGGDNQDETPAPGCEHKTSIP